MKKHLLKKVIAAASVVAVAVGVSACGGEPEQTSATTTTSGTTTSASVTTTPPVVSTTTTTTPAPLPVLDEYAEDYEKNNDFIGWIQIDGLPIDYPVVQAEDNSYYLNRNFDGEYYVNGSIFADYRAEFTTRTRPDNIVLYGHNMITGPSFAKVTEYCPWKYGGSSLDQYIKSPTLNFNTIWDQDGTYKIFAAMFVNTQSKHGEVFNYHRVHNFANDGEFYDYIGKVMDRSLFYTDVDLEYGDELITLSTCYYPLGKDANTRFVLFARRVRDGESAEVDTSKAYVNPSPLYFDYYYQVWGGSWAGRNWDASLVKGFDEYIKEQEQSN